MQNLLEMKSLLDAAHTLKRAASSHCAQLCTQRAKELHQNFVHQLTVYHD